MFDFNLNRPTAIDVKDVLFGECKGKPCFYHLAPDGRPFVIFSATSDEMKKLFALMSKPADAVVAPAKAAKKSGVVVDDLEKVSSIQAIVDKAVKAALRQAKAGTK